MSKPRRLPDVEALALGLVEDRSWGAASKGFQAFAAEHPKVRRALKPIVKAVIADDGTLEHAIDQARLTALHAAAAVVVKGGRHA